MTPQFHYAIVGRGLTGAAAARHLAEQVPGVVLIGPDEPTDRANHNGVFASHYDEGRITRTIDPDETWARLANRSIARYADVESRSGVHFFREKGCLISGDASEPSQRHMRDVREAADRLGVRCERLDDDRLRARFPYFKFPAGADAAFEPRGAGHISPRRLVAAQSLLTERAGGTVIREEVHAIDQKDGHAEITLASGQAVSAQKVLVAAGGFTNRRGLLPEPLDLTVYARTVVLIEVDAAQADELSGMPCLITKPDDGVSGIYLLPPILYPDGRFYLKIGGDPADIALQTEEDVRGWFRTPGNAAARDHLVASMMQLLPGLRVAGMRTEPCVTSFTPTGYPAIGWTSGSSTAVMAGGCGAAAKGSDEIGRLGAELLLHGRIVDSAYRADFEPRFL
ncbi:MAG: FAD-binding oxidoreductase [Rhizobium sp.]|nr:FAD-binding oxidoreductase [Rhizobium sp.]